MSFRETVKITVSFFHTFFLFTYYGHVGGRADVKEKKKTARLHLCDYVCGRDSTCFYCSRLAYRRDGSSYNSFFRMDALFRMLGGIL